MTNQDGFYTYGDMPPPYKGAVIVGVPRRCAPRDDTWGFTVPEVFDIGNVPDNPSPDYSSA